MDQDQIFKVIAEKVLKINAKKGDKKRCLSPCGASRKYIAPEIQIQNQYDQASDLWSLGCVLYELMKLLQNF